MGGPEKENLNASAAEAGEPSAASTPLREEMNRFRIVDIEPNYTEMSGIRKIGETGTAADEDVCMDTPSDANSASGEASSAMDRSDSGSQEKNRNGDANSADSAQSGGDANSAARAIPSDAKTAGRGDANTADGDKTAKSKTIPLRLQKVPAMFKEPLPPQPKPAVEPPATPSATYKAIMGGRSAKNSNLS